MKKLNAAAVEAMKSPAVREKLDRLGVAIVTEDRMTPAYLGKFVKDEIEKWGKAIKAAACRWTDVALIRHAGHSREAAYMPDVPAIHVLLRRSVEPGMSGHDGG